MLDYALKKKDAKVVGGNMSGENARELAKEFGEVRQLRDEIEKPVWHCALSLPGGERLSSEQWGKVAAAFITRMGIDPMENQYIVVQHNDTAHDHAHIIVNRIRPDGSIWNHRNDVYKAIAATQELEELFNLISTPGREAKQFAQPSFTKGEIEKHKRTGEFPAKVPVARAIAEVAAAGPMEPMAFISAMEEHGVRAVPNISKTGKMNGFSFEYEGVALKGSDVGAAWKKLSEVVQYEPERDAERLQAHRDAAKRRSERGVETGGVEYGGIAGANGGSGRDIEGRAVEDTRGSGRADEGGHAVVRTVGSGPVRPGEGVAGRTGRDEERPGLAPVAETDADDDGVGRTPGWDDVAYTLSVLARGEQLDVSTDSDARETGTMKEKPAHVRRREEIWERQHAALQAEHYRITIRGRGERDGKTINLGKDKGEAVSSLEEALSLYRSGNYGYTEHEIKEAYHNAKVNEDGTRNMEKFYTAEEVKDLIPRLEYFNATENDIYLTPIDAHTHFVLMDDLTTKGVEHIKAEGYDPCVICSSSENNFQAVLRVPRNQISEEEQSCGTALMQRLNQRLPDGCGGDKAITAVRHAFRMAGFHNKKPGRNNIQTVIQTTNPGAICQKATAEMNAVRIERELSRTIERKTAVRREAKERMRHIDSTRDRSIPRPEGETAVEKDFRYRWNRIHGLAKKNVKEGVWKDIDDSVIDFRVAVEMFQNGYAEDETAAAMYRCSPNLHVRHVDPDDYVRRTVAKAAGTVRDMMGQGMAAAMAGMDNDMRSY